MNMDFSFPFLDGFGQPYGALLDGLFLSKAGASLQLH